MKTDIKNINEEAMLVTFSTSRWAPVKAERQAVDTVATKYKANSAFINASKRIYESATLKNLNRTINDMRREHYRLTLPWTDRGDRLLPTETSVEYFKKMNNFEDEINKLKRALAEEFEGRVQDMEKELGDLFDRSDYPQAGEIADRFGVEVESKPVPEAADIRLRSLSKEMKEKLNRQFEEKIQEGMSTAVRSIYERIEERLRHMSEELDKDKPKFHETMLEKMHDLADLVPRLNVSQDKELDTLADDIRRRILNTSTKELKENPDKRKDTKKAVDEILDKAAGIMN